jgi:hypothetical protein
VIGIKMSTTAVNEKDLPVPEAKIVGAPETLELAVDRIMELEMRLEDLVRACEIASITRQLEMVDSFAMAAQESLKSKIQIEQPTAEDLKITVITDDKEDAKA